MLLQFLPYQTATAGMLVVRLICHDVGDSNAVVFMLLSEHCFVNAKRQIDVVAVP